MKVTIDLSGPDAAIQHPCEASGQFTKHPLKPKKSGYGLLAKYGPGPTAEEIDDNREDMFSGFGEDAP